MGTVWRIAWRNLGRNRRRTIVTSLAIAFGVSLCVATYGLTDGLNDQLVRTVTRLEIGHVQVHHPDYPKRRTMRYTIDQPERLLAAIDRVPEARGAAPRAFAWALVSHGGSSTGVELVGIDPRREPAVTELLERKTQGEVLPETPTVWPRGRQMTEEERAWDEAVTERQTEDALAELDALPAITREAPDATPDGAAAEPPPPSAPPDDLERTVALVKDLSPPPQTPPPIMIGERLAKTLKAQVGDLVYLLTSTSDGFTAEERFEVVGLYLTGSPMMDRTRAYLHLADLQRFVHLHDRIHEIAAVAADADEAGQLAEAIASALPAGPAAEGEAPAGDPLVRPWYEVKPMLKRMLDLNDASVGVLLFIIFVVAVLGVLNTMLMAVFERTRELGVLMALGMKPWSIRRLVMAETLLITLIGGVFGTLAGLGLDLYFLYEGWDFSGVTGGFSVGGVNVDPVLHAAIELRGLLVPLLAIAIVTVLASFYPANRAARLSPTEAMRTA